MTENVAIESTNSELGDFLIGLAADTMATVKRDGLVRLWQSPELSQYEEVEMQKMVAEAKVASDWEERAIFRICSIDLYESLGETSDVNRLLARQRVTEWILNLHCSYWLFGLYFYAVMLLVTRYKHCAHSGCGRGQSMYTY